MLFCNINFNIKNKSDLFEHRNDGKTKVIIPANAVLIAEANTSKRFFNILNDNCVTFDGKIPHIAAKILSNFKSIS